MAHNFIVGIDPATKSALPNHSFVSKSGSDSTGTGSPDSPFLTVTMAISQAAKGDTVVVGTGRYLESDVMPVLEDRKFIKADGMVIFDGQGAGTFLTTFSPQLEGVTVMNYAYFVNAERSDEPILRNCLIINCAYKNTDSVYYTGYGPWGFYNTTFIDCNIDLLPRVLHEAVNCKFFNSTLRVHEFRLTQKNCYFDVNSSINFTSPEIQADSRYAPNYNCFAYNYVEPLSGMNQNSLINTDGEFHNPNGLDFSVLPNSPLIGAGENDSNIGGVTLGTTSSSGHKSFDEAINQHPNLTVNALGELEIIDETNTTTGMAGIEVLEFPVITFDVIRYVGKINLLGVTDFIQNVPDVNNETNPNFLSFELRWAGLEQDINAQTYYLFRWNYIPTVNRDASGIITKTNGEIGFDWGLEEKIIAKTVQVKLTIKAAGKYVAA